jgi:hypothetical protein
LVLLYILMYRTLFCVIINYIGEDVLSLKNLYPIHWTIKYVQFNSSRKKIRKLVARICPVVNKNPRACNSRTKGNANSMCNVPQKIQVTLWDGVEKKPRKTSFRTEKGTHEQTDHYRTLATRQDHNKYKWAIGLRNVYVLTIFHLQQRDNGLPPQC